MTTFHKKTRLSLAAASSAGSFCNMQNVLLFQIWKRINPSRTKYVQKKFYLKAINRRTPQLISIKFSHTSDTFFFSKSANWIFIIYWSDAIFNFDAFFFFLARWYIFKACLWIVLSGPERTFIVYRKNNMRTPNHESIMCERKQTGKCTHKQV